MEKSTTTESNKKRTVCEGFLVQYIKLFSLLELWTVECVCVCVNTSEKEATLLLNLKEMEWIKKKKKWQVTHKPLNLT